MKNRNAVILFSGGIDSTTALHWALKNFSGVDALIVDYAQKHSVEVKMAQHTAASMGIKYFRLDLSLKGLAKSALMDEDREIPGSLDTAKNRDGVPHTYVPFRNGIFLSLAAAYGESRGMFDLVTGFNLIDTPDYPDTTSEFAESMEDALNRGSSASLTKNRFRIHLPLIDLTKKQIVEMDLDLGADYSYSVSCYRGSEIPCGRCPSCEIRMNAFAQLGMEDPLITRLRKEERI